MNYFKYPVCLFVIGLCLLACNIPNNNKGIQIKESNNKVTIFFNGEEKLTRSTINIILKDSVLKTFDVFIEENEIRANLGEYGIYKEIFKKESINYISGEIELTVTSDKDFIIQCPFIFEKPDSIPYFMIPCFLYGTNNIKTSTGKQPKLNYGGKPGNPESSVFSTRSDRSSHPGVFVISEKKVVLVGVHEKLEGTQWNDASKWKPDHLYTGLFLNTANPNSDIIGYTLGYEHYPYRYNGKTNNPEAPKQDEYRYGWISEKKGKELTTKTFYFIGDAKDRTDYGEALKQYYYNLHEPPIKKISRKDAIEKLIKAHQEDAWDKEHEYFRVVAQDGSEGNVGWTGGMQDVYPLLLAARKVGDKNAEKIATRYINKLIKEGINKNADLFFEVNRNGNWQVAGWWKYRIYKDFEMQSPDEFNYHSAYINGQASYYILKCYELTGRENQHWYEAAKRVIETAIKGQKKDGSYPAFFSSTNGEPVSYDWFHSCWFVPGAAILYKISGEKSYLESARNAILYYNSFHKKGEVYGTPMDTHKAVDQEGNLAFIAGCTELHKITKDSLYIPLIYDGLNWEFSWKFAYNSAHSNEPLKSLNWSTCGGSVTSTHNVHIHHMSNLIAEDIYYWYRQFNDPYLASRLKDMSIWGLGSFNTFDGEFGFGKEGWATEQFFHSDALQDNNSPWDGGVWNDYLSWSAACVLHNCASDIPDEFFGE